MTDVKPEKGLRVKVGAHREAIFGDESVNIQKITLDHGNHVGIMTGKVLVGFGEVDMPDLDGQKHWYPVGELKGEHGENVVEEEIAIEIPEDDFEGPEEEPA